MVKEETADRAELGTVPACSRLAAMRASTCARALEAPRTEMSCCDDLLVTFGA